MDGYEDFKAETDISQFNSDSASELWLLVACFVNSKMCNNYQFVISIA